MAKARKQKNGGGEQKGGDNSEAVVRHQKLCLSIDMDRRRIYGYTELEIVVPDNGIVGLHADNLAIERVTVDGDAAEFEVFPHYLHLDSENRWCSVSLASSAADAAGSVYLSSLERELVPNLLIMCCKSSKSESEQQGPTNSENGVQSSGECKQVTAPSRRFENVKSKLVRIDYWVEKTETGIHFEGNILHTDNQIRRARCWFPCMDDSSQRCCYDLEFTVANNLVAVSTGTLLHQVLSKKDPPCKTYVYELNVPVTARSIMLVVAPFEILPDRHSNLLTHMCLPANLPILQNSVGFFYSAFSHYEEYLSSSFPFGSYTQVFISPEMAVSSSSFGASMSIFSSQILFDEKVIDQTIETRIKLAYALARQWFGVYITAEAPSDEWLLDGLAGFLTDSFIKQFLGNNEARYRRYKEMNTRISPLFSSEVQANCAVCKADDSVATALSSSASSKDLYGTQCIGLYGKIRSWKSVAVLQMLEKQMGPESFRKILQKIVRAQETTCPARTLSTKEFRQFANKIGNLERPFLKEFFPRWVGSCGCPLLKMGLSYNKRKNNVELGVLRECTAPPDPSPTISNGIIDTENREGGWPGMMSIRVHELDGMYDHPILPMAGETWQLLEIQCHSKLAAKRFQKPKKGLKPDVSDEIADDIRSNADSPLLWLRADPEMEYLAEIHFNQTIQMWINQLEKDRDVVAQAQAIAALEAWPQLPQLSYSVTALRIFLGDSKAFWRIRIEAAFALANIASEEAVTHLVDFYKSRRFDANIKLPKPNDFHDFQEYFVLEAIPHAIAMIRAADKTSPLEAVEFILQLLKYNDNNGNSYSDVFWLAALVQSIGELEFGKQNVLFLSSLLKRVDRLLQFDRLMPSYNGVLTVSCIRTLTQIALKLSGLIPLDRVLDLIKPFRGNKSPWQVHIEATKALLDLEFYSKGIDAALMLFIKYLEEELSLRGQVKLGVHSLRLCQIRGGSGSDHDVKSETLVALLRLLESPLAFNNVILRHYLFCIMQVLARRPPTLFGVPRDESLRMGHAETCTELKNIFAALVKQSKAPEAPLDAFNLPYGGVVESEAGKADTIFDIHEASQPLVDLTRDNLLNAEVVREASTTSVSCEPGQRVVNLPYGGTVSSDPPREPDTVANGHEQQKQVVNLLYEGMVLPATPREDTVSNSRERKKPVVRIKVKQSAASSRAEDADATVEKSRGASSSMSVDAPQRNSMEIATVSNQNLEDVNSCHDVGSRVTASIGSAKLASDGDELVKELQCTAESSKVSQVSPPDDRLSPHVMKNADTHKSKFASLQSLSVARNDLDSGSLAVDNPLLHDKEEDKKQKKKDKDKKRKRDDHKSKRDDPEYLERKRLKKAKKQKEKEMAKLLSSDAKESLVDIVNEREKSMSEFQTKKDDAETSLAIVGGEEGKEASEELNSTRDDPGNKAASLQFKLGEPGGSKPVIKRLDTSGDAPEGNSSHKLKIRIKSRTKP